MGRYNEKQKAASLRYQKESLKQFPIKIKSEDMERYKAAAEKAGMSFRAWVLHAMDKAME